MWHRTDHFGKNNHTSKLELTKDRKQVYTHVTRYDRSPAVHQWKNHMQRSISRASLILIGLAMSPAAALANPANNHSDNSLEAPLQNLDKSPIYIQVGTNEQTHQSGYLLPDLNNFSNRANTAFATQYGSYNGPQSLAAFTISIKEQRPHNQEAEVLRFSTTEIIGGTTYQRIAEYWSIHSAAYIGSSYQTPTLDKKSTTVMIPMTENTGTIAGFYIFGTPDRPMLAISIEKLDTAMKPFSVTSDEHIDLPSRTVFFSQFVLPFDPKSKQASVSFSTNGKKYHLTLVSASIKPDSSVTL